MFKFTEVVLVSVQPLGCQAMADSDNASQKRSDTKSGKHIGHASYHQRHQEIASSATKAGVIKAAIEILTCTENASLARNAKESRLAALLVDLDAADSEIDPEVVEKLVGSWLKQIEGGELATWEIFGAAMRGLIEGRKKPGWAKKPVVEKPVVKSKQQT